MIENLVQEQVLKLLKNPHYIRECSIYELNVLNDKQKTITLDNVNVRELYLKLIEKVILTENHINVVHHNMLPFIQALVYDKDIGDITPSEVVDTIVVPIKLSKAKDGATAIIGSLENSSDSDAQHILETLKLSFRCHQSLQTGEFRSPEQVANSLNRDGKYVRLIMGLRFLSPKILDRILTQQVPSHWTLKLLFETSKIEDWQEQVEFIQF